MLGNRSMQVKIVKTSRDETPSEGLDLDKVSEIISEQIATTALVVVGTISAVKVVDTLCKIAINLTNPASWR